MICKSKAGAERRQFKLVMARLPTRQISHICDLAKLIETNMSPIRWPIVMPASVSTF